MESKQVLSIEQMQHLQELGMDTSNASMYWISYNGKSVSIPSNFHLPTSDNDYIICDVYTLQDVLDALPVEINYKGKRCWLSIDLADERIGYYYEDMYFAHKWTYHEMVMVDESLIDAAYRLLVWCIENNYISNHKDKPHADE